MLRIDFLFSTLGSLSFSGSPTPTRAPPLEARSGDVTVRNSMRQLSSWTLALSLGTEANIGELMKKGCFIGGVSKTHWCDGRLQFLMFVYDAWCLIMGNLPQKPCLVKSNSAGRPAGRQEAIGTTAILKSQGLGAKTPANVGFLCSLPGSLPG